MNVKANIIILINSKNRISKKTIRNSIGVKDSYIQSSVKWYNSFSKNKVSYDNKGYFFETKLSPDELEHLKKYITINKNIQVIFYTLVKSLNGDITNYNNIEYKGQKYNISTLNSILKYFKLPTIQEILQMNIDFRIYYCCILPLYYFEGELYLESEYIDTLKFLYEFEHLETKKYIMTETKLLDRQLHSTLISNHQRLVVSTLYLIIFLYNGQTRFTYKEIDILGKIYYIPSVMSNKLFNSIFLFESDFLFEKYSVKSYDDIVPILKKLDSIEFLNIEKGYIEPCLDKFPLYNACIYQCVRDFYYKSGYEQYTYTKIANILIAIWLQGVQNINSYNIKKLAHTDEYNLIYKSTFSDNMLFVKESLKNEIYEKGESIYIEANSLKSLFHLSKYIVFNGVITQSFDSFDIYISDDVPLYFIIDCLKRLELNCPNANICVKKVDLESVQNKTYYTFISNSKYKTFPIIVTNNNYDFNDIQKIKNDY